MSEMRRRPIHEFPKKKPFDTIADYPIAVSSRDRTCHGAIFAHESGDHVLVGANLEARRMVVIQYTTMSVTPEGMDELWRSFDVVSR